MSWAPIGKPFTEAVVNGLCGGPGFLYAVFEYKGWPPILSIALQTRSMPDAYIAQGLGRLGVVGTRRETASAAVAGRELDAVIEAGRPAVCAFGLRTVSVVGRCDGDYWVDGRAPVPTRLSAAALARARGGYKAARHRLVTVDGVQRGFDPLSAVRNAIADTARAYVDPPVPKGFKVNCGFAGIGKWQRLLVDDSDRKAWPALFPDGARACAGLTRAYGWFACFVAPGAGRPMYAAFLDSAAEWLGAEHLAEAAGAFRESGREWAAMADFIAAIDDPAVQRGCAAAEDRLATLDLEGDCGGSESPLDLVRSQQTATADCRLTRDQVRSIYGEMSRRLGMILEIERGAVAAMAASVLPVSRT